MLVASRKAHSQEWLFHDQRGHRRNLYRMTNLKMYRPSRMSLYPKSHSSVATTQQLG